jgi:prepilin-type N-terminal cleavage/methylation domain-containing protein
MRTAPSTTSETKKDQGFTLIELLVVVVIIGILAAIAIPVFLNQREKAVEAGIKSDLKNAATAQEAYLVDNDTYTSTVADLPGFKLTEGNAVSTTGDASGYCIRGGKAVDAGDFVPLYVYDSLVGGLFAADEVPADGACA